MDVVLTSSDSVRVCSHVAFQEAKAQTIDSPACSHNSGWLSQSDNSPYPQNDWQGKSYASLPTDTNSKDERLDCNRILGSNQCDEDSEVSVSSFIFIKGENMESRTNQDSWCTFGICTGTTAACNATQSESPRTANCDPQQYDVHDVVLNRRADNVQSSSPTDIVPLINFTSSSRQTGDRNASSGASANVDQPTDSVVSDTTPGLNDQCSQPSNNYKPKIMSGLSGNVGNIHLINVREAAFRKADAARRDLHGLAPLDTRRSRSTAYIPVTRFPKALTQPSAVASHFTILSSDNTASGPSQLDLAKGYSLTASEVSKDGARFKFPSWAGVFRKTKSVDKNLNMHTGDLKSTTVWRSYRKPTVIESAGIASTFAGVQPMLWGTRMPQTSVESERPKTLKRSTGLTDPPPPIPPRRQQGDSYSSDPPPLPPRPTADVHTGESAEHTANARPPNYAAAP